MDLLELGGFLWGHLSLEKFKCQLQGGILWCNLNTRGPFAEFKSPSENLANVQNDIP